MPDAQSVIDSVGRFFKGAGQVAVQALDELGLFQEKIQAIVDKWAEIKSEWDSLFEPDEVENSANWRVLKLFDAQDILENIRINSLKDRAQKLYAEINDIWQLILHPIGGSAEADQAILAGAQAYAGKPGAGAGAFRAASIINSVLNFGDQVLKLEQKILELLQLLNVIGDMRMQMEEKVLSQANAQVSVDSTTRQRQGALRS